MPGKTLTDFRW